MAVPKISLLGLDNAGKTSILKNLEENFNSEKDLIATKGIERRFIQFLGSQICIWDYGGQQVYRENYLQRSERMLTDIDCIYYIIDVQDQERYNQAVEFLCQLLQTQEDDLNSIQVVIFLHKYDPKLGLNANLQIDLKNLLKDLSIMLKSFNLPLKYYYTSIFEPFSVISAFSQPILHLEGTQRLLFNTLYNFALEYKLDVLMLMSEPMIDLGHYIIPRLDTPEFQKEIMDIIYDNSRNSEISVEWDSVCVDVHCKLSKVQFSAGNQNQPLYFIWGSKNAKNYYHNIVEHLIDLRNNIQTLLSETSIS